MKDILRKTDRLLTERSKAFPWTKKEVYACYMAQTYYYVSHSTRLLGLAAGRLPLEHEQLHKRFMEHAHEEKGHQFLALHDVKAVGCRIEDYPQLAETAAFYEPQYYKVEHQDPLALMGYILCLESFAVADGLRIYKLAADAFGKPAATFMKAHAEDDPEHVEKALKVVEVLNPHQKELVVANIEQSCRAWIHLMDACQEFAATKMSDSLPFLGKKAA